MDYSKGKIYLIECSISKQKYIGSTIRTLEDRFAAHRKNRNRIIGKLYTHMIEHGIKNFSISLIEDYPCDNRHELEKREAYYQHMHNTVNEGLNSIYASVPELTKERNKKMNAAKCSKKYREKKKLIEETKEKMRNSCETDKESYEKIKILIQEEEKRHSDTIRELNSKLLVLETR